MAISAVPRRCSMGYRKMDTLPMAVYGLHLIYGSPVRGRLTKKISCNVNQWGLAARRCLFSIGPQYGRRARRVSRLRWLRMVYVDIRVLWRPGFLQYFLWMVPINPIEANVWGEYANSLRGWLLEAAYYVDGSWWSQFPVGDVSTTELLSVAHWHVWRHLQSSSWFAAHPLSFLCRRWWAPSKLFFVEMKYFCYVQLTCHYRHSYAWFD